MDEKELIKAASTVAEVATEALTETKPWYLSKTIIGGTVTVAAAIGGAFGLHIDLATQQGLVEAILYLTGGLGGVVSIIGRIMAVHKVGH